MIAARGFAIVADRGQPRGDTMSEQRRKFLQLAALAPTTAVAGVVAAPRQRAKAPASMLTRSEFERCLGDSFAFETEVFADVAARLSAVDAHAGSVTTAQREGRFSLLFETKGDALLEQGSYRVHHERLGDFILFVSPKDVERHTVEAVFNRL
jgi:hypothetical protein